MWYGCAEKHIERLWQRHEAHLHQMAGAGPARFEINDYDERREGVNDIKTALKKCAPPTVHHYEVPFACHVQAVRRMMLLKHVSLSSREGKWQL